MASRVVTETDIKTALRSVAILTDLYGDKYWPIFERLEKELEARHSRRSRLAAVLNDV